MRKAIINQTPDEHRPQQSPWLDLEALARVELTSEDPGHPIESALRPGTGPGWRAVLPGPQTVRLLFDTPLTLRQVYLEFTENETPRTQEFVLRWSPDRGRSYREIVRQQFNFTPPGTSFEREEYWVELSGVTALELILIPALGHPEVCASLTRLLLA